MSDSNKRAANFTKIEESLLLRVVNSHSIIENKKTDAVTNKMKNDEWTKIAVEFNAQNVGQARDSGTLKRKYENIKRGVKHKLREEKKSEVHTGGGPELQITLDSEEMQLLQVMGPQATGLPNKYGDDDDEDQQIVMYDLEILPHELKQVGDEMLVESTILGSSSSVMKQTPPPLTPCSSPIAPASSLPNPGPSLSAATPPLNAPGPSLPASATIPPKKPSFNPDSAASLRTAPHPVLRQAKNSRAVDRMSSWAASKNSFVQEELQMKKEEHTLKMKQMEEEGKLRKILLQQQIDHAKEQQDWLREERMIKMVRLKEGLQDCWKGE